MKTLNVIQTVAKIAKILCKIGFICCLVVGVLCAAGILSLALFPESFKLGGVTIHSMIESSARYTTGDTYIYMAAAGIMCVGYAVLSRMAERYLTNELAAGTPFTFDGAKELLRLGICTVCVPIGTEIVARIVCRILKKLLADAYADPFEIALSVWVGAVVIFLSLVCKYGAEVLNGNVEKEEETA